MIGASNIIILFVCINAIFAFALRLFIVISNSVYGWIKAGQKSSFDKRYYSVDFTRTDHAKVASAYGLKTWTVKKSKDLKKTISQALKQKGPCLIDIISQPLQDANAPVSEWIA